MAAWPSKFRMWLCQLTVAGLALEQCITCSHILLFEALLHCTAGPEQGGGSTAGALASTNEGLVHIRGMVQERLLGGRMLGESPLLLDGTDRRTLLDACDAARMCSRELAATLTLARDPADATQSCALDLGAVWGVSGARAAERNAASTAPKLRGGEPSVFFSEPPWLTQQVLASPHPAVLWSQLRPRKAWRLAASQFWQATFA